MGAPKGWDEGIVTEAPEGWDAVAPSTSPPTIGQDIPLANVPGEALSNLPSSAWETAKGVVSPLVHPVDTVKSIGRTMAGGADLLQGIDTPEAQGTKDIGKYFVERYGGYENLKRTAAKDPVGLLMDVATVLQGGGGLISKVGAAGKAGEVGGLLSKVGEAVNPVTQAAKGVGKVVAPVADWLSSRITESVYKLPVKTKLGKREAMTETIKEYGVQPSKEGWLKVKDTITKKNIMAAELKAYATESGAGVRQDVLVSALDDFAKTLEGGDLPKTAQRVVENYKKKFIAEGKPFYSVSDLDTLESSLDKALKPVYVGEIKINPGFRTSIVNDAKRALRQRVDELTKERVPGLASLEKEQSRLLQIEPKIQEAANRIHNWSAVTLYDFLFAGGAYYTHAPLEAAASAVAWRVVRSPQVQQYVARGLRATSKASIPANTLGKAGTVTRAADLLGPTP